MRGASAPLLAWGCLQLLLGGGLAAFSEATPALLFLAAAAPVLALAAWNWKRPQADSPRLLPALSVPTVIVAVGLATAVAGLTAGLWLGLIGVEIALFGAIWLGREVRDERRWEP